MTTIDKIKAEIQKVLDAEPDTENAKAQVLALFWVLELLDKYAEQEPMREFTEEECKAHSKALDKMYKPTGFNVFNEPCDDAVSRQAAKDLFCRICMENNICYRSKDTCEDLKLFDQLPPVRPQEQTGHWIHKGQGIYCSECGKESGYNPFGASRFSDYCPSCGCRMIEPRESEDKECR